ncbi:TonB-dependent receptor [Campylobacter sp. Marseille-Q3452]|uniref:TonB-dependent receptor n=1 Tax=Campylobacter massiliensis TaxID=2762557 RepID=A0A842J5B5_9BACT|nr:TonB-dependent receptor [Campylobacter massiliensis]MBC2881990.1 TonB-dependent receptor [Campylobacter massiliensis]
MKKGLYCRRQNAVYILSLIVAVNLYAADEKNTKLEKTVITSTGFETPLRDEVKNVYIITSEEIKDRGYASVTEVLERAPGIYIRNSGEFGAEEIDMRGQGDYAKTNVRTLVNGMDLNVLKAGHGNITTPFNLIAVEDIERIEIIPGGGSVLYGGGTTGGVINIITKKKPSKFYVNASSKLASYSYRDLAFGIGGPVSEDLFLKFSAKGFDSKSYRKEEKNKGHYFSGALNYQINDKQNIAITPSYYSQKLKNQSGPLTLRQVEQDRRQSGETQDPQKYTKTDLSIDYSIDFSDSFQTHIMPYYLKTKYTQEGEIVGAGAVKRSYQTKFSDRKYGTNFKNRFKYGSGELVFGYDYEDIFDKLSQGDELGKTIYSAYLVEKHDFTDWFSLSGGARYERALYDVKRPESKANKRPAFHQSKHTNSHAFDVIPNFKYSDTGNVYFKFEKGFVSPSPQELVDVVKVDNHTEFKFNGLKPETFRSFEIGIKDTIFDQFFSATVFKTYTKDMIFLKWKDPLHGLGQRIFEREYINLDKATRSGLELYAEQNLFSDKLKLTESFSYVDSKATFTRQGKEETKSLPYVAKRKIVLGVDYAPIKTLNIYVSLRNYSKILNSSYEYMSAKTLVDLSAKYKFTKNFSLSGGVKNLFDKKYYSYYDSAANRGAGVYYPSAERNFYVEFKYTY